jgi:hypothetical protein
MGPHDAVWILFHWRNHGIVALLDSRAAVADGSVRFLPDATSPLVLEEPATVRAGSPAGVE